jgi:hypothetical protein
MKIIFSILLSTVVFTQNWYKGNTHAHTIICGHADSAPEVVTQWYHDRGYNFLILSEHNHFINPDSVVLPENKREDFILIPGQEITGSKTIHTTAMNIDRVIPWSYDDNKKFMIIQNHVNETNSAGGHTILNHPNYKYAVDMHDILPVEGLYLFELYNGHPVANNYGDSLHLSTEAMWDSLLTLGYKVFGVSSDDAHFFENIGPEISNPGKGWVMVDSPTLDSKHITAAMIKGNFYSTNGVMLKSYQETASNLFVDVDTAETISTINSLNLMGKCVSNASPGYRIDLIGPGGIIISTIPHSNANFAFQKIYTYVRIKITFTTQSFDDSENCIFQEYYAWIQPKFY